MEPFSVNSFVAEPTLSLLNSLKKSQLTELANYYKLPVSGSMKKGEIKKLITVYLIDEELVPEEDREGQLPDDSSTLELKHLEFQEREKAREAELKMKELEIRKKELSIQLRMKELETPVPARTRSPSESSGRRAMFDVSKHIKLVPPFQEREVDKYFLHFEKIATSLEWPREVWMLLLQSVLVGKAREIYSGKSLEEEHPFVSEGFISLTEEDEKLPIKILRDTGASQSLMIQSVLPLSDQTSMATSVLIQGVELSTVTVPLHRVYLHSDLITGPVIVGIRPTLPVKGVSLVLGNNLAGGKVKPDLRVMEHPDQFAKTETDNAAVYPACVVTRAAAQMAKLQDKEISNPEHMEASLSNNQPNCPTECGNSVPVFEAENSNSNLSLSREQLIRIRRWMPKSAV